MHTVVVFSLSDINVLDLKTIAFVFSFISLYPLGFFVMWSGVPLYGSSSPYPVHCKPYTFTVCTI